MMTIGETIKQLRESRQLSQANLANQLGVSRQTVSNWENDKTIPSLDYMKLLAEQYGLSLDHLSSVREGEVGLENEKKFSIRPLIYSLGCLIFLSLLMLSHDSMPFIAQVFWFSLCLIFRLFYIGR